MLIERWMKRHPQTAKPRDSIAHAREVMEKHRINQLPVVTNGQLVGIVTDRDLRDAYPSALAPAERSPLPKETPVEDVMTQNALSLGPKDTVEHAARLMRKERIGAVPIIEGKQLVGILTRSDVLEAFLSLSEGNRSGSL
jgi:acetoin utilization protein AcuB